MQNTKLFRVNTIQEAIDTMSYASKPAAYVAGGTDIVVDFHRQNTKNVSFIDITPIPDLKRIEVDQDRIKIGALSTFSDIIASEEIKEHAKALYIAAKNVGSEQIRNLGTIGGNIGNAAPAADSLGPLLALGADICCYSKSYGFQNETIDDYLQKATYLEDPTKLILSVSIPKRSNSQSTYIKIGKRKALAILVLGLAIRIDVDRDGRCRDASIVVSAVSPKPVRLKSIEAILINNMFTNKEWSKMLPMFAVAVENLIPNRESMPYKRACITAVAEEAFRDIEFGLDRN